MRPAKLYSEPNMKKKCILTSTAALYMLTLTSCSSIFYSKSNALEKIKSGMSPQEVTDLLGKPQYRRLDYGLEEWEFRQLLNPLDGEPTVIIVRFEDDQLVYLVSFKESERQPQTATPPASSSQKPPIVIVPGHAIGYSVSEKQFNEFYNKVKSRPFKDEQLKLIRAGVENKYFTCKQCARMMSLYAFDDEKLTVLKLFAAHIVDKENYDVISKEIMSLFDQEKVPQILGL